MNYALALSLRMEEILLEFQNDRSKIPLSILADEEAANEDRMLNGGRWVPPPNPFATLGKKLYRGSFCISLRIISPHRTHRKHVRWFDANDRRVTWSKPFRG